MVKTRQPPLHTGKEGCLPGRLHGTEKVEEVGQVDFATLSLFTRLSLIISTLGSGDRIVPTLREGVTAEDPEYSHPGSTGPAVPFDRLVSVLRARRVVATGAGEEVGKRPLVGADGSEQQDLQRGSTSAREP